VSTAADIAFFTEAIRQMNELGMQRRLRILPPSRRCRRLWFPLVGGGIITVSSRS
jgi:hypothetical protein